MRGSSVSSTTRFWTVHGAAALLGAALLVWPAVPTDTAVWTFVLLYNLAWGLWTYRADDRRAFRIWRFILPLSLLQLFPDWFLVESLGTLSFAPHRPTAGPVPLYMALMWSYPLVVVTHAGMAARRRLGTLSGRLAAAATALVLFGSAELLLTRIPIWQAHDVVTYHGAALYILAAEAFLGLTTFEAFRRTRRSGPGERLVAAALVMVGYLGAAGLSHLVFEQIIPA